MTTLLRTNLLLIAACCATLLCTSCRRQAQFRNPILAQGNHPYALFYKGQYYYAMQSEHADRVTLYRTDDLTKLAQAERKTVWVPTDPAGKTHIWSPELHRINGKWYVYYEADDGNTDNHQIYVIENTADDPMEGHFQMKGSITTNDEGNWTIHPTSFVVGGKQYLAWSGWPKRRVESETQCIYIAQMANPWTLASPRVKISTPTCEWERQWINPDGERSAYPIYVNENPQAFLSRDGRYIVICYAASGCWTLYTCSGMLYADVRSNLLNPASWHKAKEPVFQGSESDSIYAATNICVVPSPDGKESYFLYEAKRLEDKAQIGDVRLQPLQWDAHGLPVFGKPSPAPQKVPGK